MVSFPNTKTQRKHLSVASVPDLNPIAARRHLRSSSSTQDMSFAALCLNRVHAQTPTGRWSSARWLHQSISSLRPPEKQNIPIRVLEFESTQAITRILDWHKKLDIAGRELCRQRIRIGDVDVRVPAGNALFDVPCVVRHWSHADFLEHEHRAAALTPAALVRANASGAVTWTYASQRAMPCLMSRV